MRFKNISYVLEGTFVLHSMPDGFEGLAPSTFRADRWVPRTLSDKIATSALPERYAEWIKVREDLFYGLERGGDINEEGYIEYYSVIIIRPGYMTPDESLKICSMYDYRGRSGSIIIY